MNIECFTFNSKVYKNISVDELIARGFSPSAIHLALFAQRKTEQKRSLVARCNAEIEQFVSRYPLRVCQTFDLQRQEALAYSADNNYESTLLLAMAESEGADVSDIVGRILSKADDYASRIGIINGTWNKLSHKLDAMSPDTHTIEDIKSITWESE